MSGKLFDRWYVAIGALVALMLPVFLLIGYVTASYKAYRVSSASMTPTLFPGELVMADLRAYDSAPLARGDVVVFNRPDDTDTDGNESKVMLLYRIIALGGDTVECKDTAVYVNSSRQEEPYARWTEGGIREGIMGPVTVPMGKLFLMGDNRDHSRDSRFWSDPFVPGENVTGKLSIIYYSPISFSRIGSIVR